MDEKTFTLPAGIEIPQDAEVGDTICIYAKLTAKDSNGSTFEFDHADKSMEEQEAPAEGAEGGGEKNPQVEYAKSKKREMMAEE